MWIKRHLAGLCKAFLYDLLFGAWSLILGVQIETKLLPLDLSVNVSKAHVYFVMPAEMNWSLATLEIRMLWASSIFLDLTLLALRKIKAEGPPGLNEPLQWRQPICLSLCTACKGINHAPMGWTSSGSFGRFEISDFSESCYSWLGESRAGRRAFPWQCWRCGTHLHSQAEVGFCFAACQCSLVPCLSANS